MKSNAALIAESIKAYTRAERKKLQEDIMVQVKTLLANFEQLEASINSLRADVGRETGEIQDRVVYDMTNKMERVQEKLAEQVLHGINHVGSEIESQLELKLEEQAVAWNQKLEQIQDVFDKFKKNVEKKIASKKDNTSDIQKIYRELDNLKTLLQRLQFGSGGGGDALPRFGKEGQILTKAARGYRWENNDSSKIIESIGDGANNSFTIAHGLDTRDVIVNVWRNSPPYDRVIVDVQLASSNTVNIIFNEPPTEDEYRVVIIG